MSKQRLSIGLGVLLLGLLALGALLISPRISQASQPAPGGATQPGPHAAGTYRGLLPVAHFDISPPLRDMVPLKSNPNQLPKIEDKDLVHHGPGLAQPADPVVQRLLGALAIPTPLVSFDGPPNLCGGCAPPDPNGEAGPNHIVVMTNLDFQIFNKTGTSLFGPAANNTLWTGFGGPCQNENRGDPVVLYDQLADRWLLTQFTAAGPTFYNCAALSTGPDPTGTYYRYAFSSGPNFPDYPKWSMGPDAYYISTREFLGLSGPFQGVGAYAANRTQMLAGNLSPQVISFLAPPNPAYVVGDGLLPADLDGTALPPAGSDEYYMGSQDDNGPYGAPSDGLTLWKFHVDFGTPANSSFTLANTIATAPFNTVFPPCPGGSRSCVPQPGTANRIDSLISRQRPLFRLAYRNMGTYETLLTNQTVNAGQGPTEAILGERWYEVRSPASNPVIFQQGTYAPGITDGIDRWLGSVAMNGAGSIALGYSASSATVFPSVYYTGRLDSDPAGQMPQGEAAIINGTGSQTGGGNRWGDYTDMTVDPTDDCTFWYVNEYIPTTSLAGWRARIGSFRFGSCPAQGTPTPTGTPASTATATSGPATSTATAVPPTSTATATSIVILPTSTRTATSTAVPPTSTRTATSTAVPPTSTRVPPTSTQVPPTASATPCAISFTDVNPPDYFYVPVQYLYCHGVISGYSDNTFRPYNNTTRSQMVKIVVLGFQKPIQTPAAGGFTFTDVPPTNPFFGVIETAAALNIVSGYTCGGPGEPCDANNRPYFRPFANVTRGQLSKIDTVAAGWVLQNPPTGTFADVLPNTAFYEFVETAACHGVISGYTCGGPGEPCGTGNRPYFRQNNEATRGQISKIVYLSINGIGPCGVPTQTQ